MALRKFIGRLPCGLLFEWVGEVCHIGEWVRSVMFAYWCVSLKVSCVKESIPCVKEVIVIYYGSHI